MKRCILIPLLLTALLAPVGCEMVEGLLLPPATQALDDAEARIAAGEDPAVVLAEELAGLRADYEAMRDSVTGAMTMGQGGLMSAAAMALLHMLRNMLGGKGLVTAKKKTPETK